MKVTISFLEGLACIILLAGCSTPQFACNAPPGSLDASGPSIVLLPLVDNRSDHLADGVFRSGYLAQVQSAIGQDLQGMRYFSSVTVATTNEALPRADWQVIPTLTRLNWEVPNHGAVATEKAIGHAFNFVGNLTLGLPAGNLVLHSGTPIYGYSAMDVTVKRTADQKLLMNMQYSDAVTNRVKKSDCDKKQTRADIMLAAFQNTEEEFKGDLLKHLVQDKYATPTVKPADAPKPR